MKCSICKDKGYLISTRSDGREAVERCDECQWFGLHDPRTKYDEDVVQLARIDGIDCLSEYPCLVLK